MTGPLEGHKVAILATDGVEQVELTEPRKALEQAGAETVLVSLKPGEIQAFHHLDKGDRFKVDQTVDEVGVEDFDALFLPGGVANPDQLRTSPKAVKLVRDFFAERKPVAAICHGPWMLVEADVVRHRTLTSWPSLRTDICNAGGRWVDEQVVVDNGLVTSRKPADLPAFDQKMVEAFAEGIHRIPGHHHRPEDLHDVAPENEDAFVDVSSADSFPASDSPSSLRVT